MDTAEDGLEVIGEFACGGVLVLCDTVPDPSLADPSAARPDSQCLHLAVRPGRYRVEYRVGDDGAGSIPAEVIVSHQGSGLAAPSMPPQNLQVEGGRIAVIDREQSLSSEVCKDFEYEAPDAVQHDCGLVISTWGDGVYPVRVWGDGGVATRLTIVLGDES